MNHDVSTNSLDLFWDTRLFDRVSQKYNVDYAFHKIGPNKHWFFSRRGKKAVNVPACQCPGCNKVVISDLILGKLESFAEYEKGNTIDFAKCEQDEAAIFTFIHTSWR